MQRCNFKFVDSIRCSSLAIFRNKFIGNQAAYCIFIIYLNPKVVLLCAYEMKEIMKMTSETLFTTSTWYEAENGSNGSCNFVFNSGPQVCSGPSIPKHAVKLRIFSESEIVHRKMTVVLRHFVRKRRSFLKHFFLWKTTVVFVQNISKRRSFSGELFQIRGKCVPSQHVLELKDHCKLVGQSWKRSYMTYLNHFQPHIMY